MEAPNLTVQDVWQHLNTLLAIPAFLNYQNYPPTVSYAPVSDPCTLTCGCLVSKSLADIWEMASSATCSTSIESQSVSQRPLQNSSSPSTSFDCGICGAKNVSVIGECTPMKNMYIYMVKLGEELSTYNGKHKEKERLATSPRDLTDMSSMFSQLSTDTKKDSRSIRSSQASSAVPVPISNQPQGNINLLTAFHEALVDIHKPSSVDSNEPKKTVSDHNRSPQEYYFDESKPRNVSTSNIQNHGYSPTEVSFISSQSSVQKQRSRQASFPGSSNLTRLLSSTPSVNKKETGMMVGGFHSSPSKINQNGVISVNTTTGVSISGGLTVASSNAILDDRKKKDNNKNKELLLSKNFPIFRKVHTFNIHSTTFLLKSKLYVQTQLSHHLTKLVLLSEKKWEVYTIDTERPDKDPVLLCCGRSDASYGQNFDNLKKMKKDQILLASNITIDVNDTYSFLEGWEHLNCQLTENLLIISGTRGFVRIIDLNQKGRCVYTYKCNFPIRSLDISPNEEFIALGITGKDKYTEVEQAVIIVLRIIPESSKSSMQIQTLPFSLPYRDPIGIMKFSPDSTLLSVATVLESRFLIISLADPSKPTMVMKSQRRLDTSLDSEGITDISFFPDNRLMALTSSSHNSEPIIVDSNIDSISGPDGIAKPRLLMKIEEVGSTIHKCCVSPRGDSVAFVNRNGNVYIMAAPRMDDNDNKRIVNVFDVSNAARAREAASVRFDPDGYKLYALDRKGLLTIADYTAGTVEDHTVTRCKIIA